MELQQLRYVAAVAREKHFGRAAERVHITQPTLSQQIIKLEKELGAALFERSPRGVVLTAEGEKFLSTATAVLEILENSVRELKEKGDDITGRIRLAVIPTLGPYLLPPVLQHVRKKAPRLTLELFDMTTSLLLENLKQNRIDMGILALPIEEPGIVALSIGKEPFYLAVPQKHPLASRKSVDLAQVRRERLLILQEGHCFRNQALAYCGLSAEDDQIIFQGSSLTSVMRLAAAGEGVTFVPRIAARAREHPGLRFIRFSGPEPIRELGVVWRVTTPLSTANRFLIDVIESTFSRGSYR